MRATALLTPEATPVWPSGTAPMTAAVRGPTARVMPTAITVIPTRGPET